MSEKIKLDVDWDALFPVSDVKIGSCLVPIKPLELQQLSRVMGLIKNIGSSLVESGVTWDNYNTPAGMIPLVNVCLMECPEILSESTGVRLEDIKRLPIAENVKLLAKALEVNMEAKESLEKNFESLTENLSQLTGQEEEVPESPEQ